MNDRQNPFEDLAPWDETSDNDDREREPAAYLPPPLASLNRNRTWEKQQRTGDYCQVSYRKIPAHIRDQMREIAQAQYVRIDDVARLFLTYALDAYEAGNIEIKPVLEQGRLTLFPEK